MSPTLSIVLATYEGPRVLDTTLRALSEQRNAEVFDVVVADDGSGSEVAAVVERWERRIDLRHVWQSDEGFRKARVLNLASASARGDYLIFLDFDCVPRRGFVRAIRRGAISGWFLTTKRLNLGHELSRRIAEDGLPAWRWSAFEWFVRASREVRRPGYLLPARDWRRPWRAGSRDFAPPWSAYCMIGVFRKDFERVNGYDARCTRWDDGEDQDLAVRLRRAGLRCGWPGPSATAIHLWHSARSDATPDRLRLFRETLKSDRMEAVTGLRELERELRDSGDGEPRRRLEGLE